VQQNSSIQEYGEEEEKCSCHPTILLIDDNEFNLCILVNMISRMSFNMKTIFEIHAKSEEEIKLLINQIDIHATPIDGLSS
jgi:hypothetical protein